MSECVQGFRIEFYCIIGKEPDLLEGCAVSQIRRVLWESKVHLAETIEKLRECGVDIQACDAKGNVLEEATP